MTNMTCPKCRGEMHTYERKGVTVEQCSDCRGLFLDRGELERLVAAESEWVEKVGRGPSTSALASPGSGSGRRRERDDDDDDDYGRDYPKRRKSFLSELLG